MRLIAIGLVFFSSVAVAAPSKQKAPKRAPVVESSPSEELVYQSTRLCVARDVKRTAEAAIAKEKHYGKKYGVVDLAHINDQIAVVQDADDEMADARLEIKRIGKPLVCSHPQIGVLASCIADKFGDSELDSLISFYESRWANDVAECRRTITAEAN